MGRILSRARSHCERLTPERMFQTTKLWVCEWRNSWDFFPRAEPSMDTSGDGEGAENTDWKRTHRALPKGNTRATYFHSSH